MKTANIKASQIRRDWWVVDAAGLVLGRLAAPVAQILRGKHKPGFSTHLDNGDHVIVVNAGKVRLTGKKAEDKLWYRHSGYPGGLTATPTGKILRERPEVAVDKAIRGMLPHTRLGRSMASKLKVYPGPEHPHGAQHPRTLVLEGIRPGQSGIETAAAKKQVTPADD